MSSNYNAIVVELNGVRKHENADRLQCVNIFGNNVIVGLDTKDGDIGLFFPLESQIGEEFAQVNDLIRRKDESGKVVGGGMFEKNRRVKTKKLREEKSMGFYCPMSYLHKLELSLLEEGDNSKSSFNVGDEIGEFKGVIVSQKYVVPTKPNSNQSQQGKKPKESRVVPNQFHFHFDTSHLGRNLHKISPDDLISITWKTHGTSGVCGSVLVKKKLNVWEKLLQKVGINVVDTEYDMVYSSRKVIKNDDKEYSHFYGEDIWAASGESFKDKLHKGETCYYEIVGYLASGGFIQKGFDYGCKAGEHLIQVYRITQTNVDGIVTELPWHQVKHRCTEIGVDTVPEIYYGKVKDYTDEWWNFPEPSKQMDNFYSLLSQEYVYDQDSKFCINKVPEEGIVVRVERGDGIENFKSKSFAFCQYESKQMDKGEADIEEVGESV